MKTPQGKARSAMNALKHGLTGQTVLLPSDDREVYRKHCERYVKELRPSGIVEEQMVQTIANAQWRLNRLGGMQNDLFAKEGGPSLDDLARLSLYEQRATRTLFQTMDKLTAIQKARKSEERLNFARAAEICRFKDKMGEEWKPSDNGFEFSLAQLDAYIEREDTRGEAALYYLKGKLPARYKPQLPEKDELAA